MVARIRPSVKEMFVSLEQLLDNDPLGPYKHPMSIYEPVIRQQLAFLRKDLPGREMEIEAIMRIEHPTLDHLSAEAFAAEVGLAVELIETTPESVTREIAESMGFRLQPKAVVR